MPLLSSPLIRPALAGRRKEFRVLGAKALHHMLPEARTASYWSATTAFASATLCALAILTLALGVDLRGDAASEGVRLERVADGLAARLDGARPARERALLAGGGAGAARIVGRNGRVRVEAGPRALFARGDAGWSERLATAGAGAWTLRSDAIEVSRALPAGERLVLRSALPGGSGTLGLVAPIPLMLAFLAGLLAAGLAWWRSAVISRRLARLASAAEAAAAGRPGPVAVEGRWGWRRLGGALNSSSARAAELQRAAESRLEALGAAISPLPLPVAARTPARGLIRNEALEALVAALTPADATQVDEAVAQALAASGPVGRRLVLGDGRALEVESWAVPGGRLVVVAERTEQVRLGALRRQLTGAAARQLNGPVKEVKAVGSELLGEVPAATAPTVRRLLAAADRMERLVARILRGTANDPRASALKPRSVGAAAIFYSLGQTFDRRLRDRGLRLEHDLAADLPPLRSDPALVGEILTELVANSAAFTPRGGTITLAARELPGGQLELAVADTGPGIPAEELPAAAERFARGRAAAGLPGTGLGLGVATALAERLGGRLILEPGPEGRGRLELPAGPRPQAPAPAEPAPAAVEEPAEPVAEEAPEQPVEAEEHVAEDALNGQPVAAP